MSQPNVSAELNEGMLGELGAIEGLKFERNGATHRGLTAMAFPEQRSFYVVVHGSESFSYPHFGVHLGQEDQLTFFCSQEKEFQGVFLDCRRNSSTFGSRVSTTIRTSAGRRLVIPQGVAHAFSGLEGIFTVNTYRLFLPDIDQLVDGRSGWRPENDVLNLPLDTMLPPAMDENRHLAAPVLYEILGAHHRKRALEEVAYPIVQDVQFVDGMRRVKLIPISKQRTEVKNPLELRRGGAWERHPYVVSGPQSGLVVFPSTTGFECVQKPADMAMDLTRSPGAACTGFTFFCADGTELVIGSEGEADRFAARDVHRSELRLVGSEHLTIGGGASLIVARNLVDVS